MRVVLNAYSSEVSYFKHLKTHTIKELEILRKIAEIKLTMTDEEERKWNLDFVSLLYYLEQDNVGFDIGNFHQLEGLKRKQNEVRITKEERDQIFFKGRKVQKKGG